MHKYNDLTKEEFAVIKNKFTEPSFTGVYDDFNKPGIYICRQCNLPLFDSKAKFDAGCGWPAFEDTFPNSVKEILDDDGQRTEIQCSRCGAHLGHVFKGEDFTSKNTRHCVNSISLKFISETDSQKYLGKETMKLQRIIFGGGCFWCIDAAIYRIPGVIKTTAGYSGGNMKNPSYEKISMGSTGHAEVVEVVYDVNTITLTELLAYFFKLHDPTSLNKQGNDEGEQYRSIILYENETDHRIINETIKTLQLGLSEKIVTQVEQLKEFYVAEDYHQRYFEKNRNTNSYCQFVVLPKVIKINQILKQAP